MNADFDVLVLYVMSYHSDEIIICQYITSDAEHGGGSVMVWQSCAAAKTVIFTKSKVYSTISQPFSTIKDSNQGNKNRSLVALIQPGGLRVYTSTCTTTFTAPSSSVILLSGAHLIGLNSV